MESNWRVVRKMADRIAGGERSYDTLLRDPSLSPGAFDALQELEDRKLVRALFSQDLVEPKPAFWPWFDDLRNGKAQYRESASPAKPPITRPQAAGSAVSTSTSSDETCTRAGNTAPKARRRPIKRPDLNHLDRMCVTILDDMRRQGHRLPLAKIGSDLNAYRDRDTFKRAIQKLQNLRSIRVDPVPKSRRKWVTLLEIPPRFEEPRLKPRRRRHAPRSRGQTEWFRNFMAEQELAE